jgi:hypothetical protein
MTPESLRGQPEPCQIQQTNNNKGAAMRGMFNKKIILAAALPALLLGAQAARADTTLPPRKPGLWQTTMVMKMSVNGNPMPGGPAPSNSVMCSDAKTDAESMKKMAGGDGHCSQFSINGGGNVYTMQGTCSSPMGGGMMTIHSTMTKESDTKYHLVTDTSSAMMSGNMVADSTWLGACPAGVAPGDFGSMQNGQFVKSGNMFEMHAQPMPPPQ